MQWFLQLLEELGIECRVGHPAKIRQRDADLVISRVSVSLQNAFKLSHRSRERHQPISGIKKGGNTTTSGRIVVAPDGKSRTVTTSRTDAKGKKVSSNAVCDKQ
jgi:hypothetical protein